MNEKELKEIKEEIESLKKEIKETNEIIKQAANWTLEALSLISRNQGYFYESDKPLR